MKIAIVGTGKMATSLTTVLSKGNEITIYGRNEAEAKILADQHGAKAQKLADSIPEEIIILALPYSSISSFLQENAKLLQDKIVVDVSNAVDWQKMELLHDEGAAKTAKSLPQGAKLIKAFNTIFADVLATGEIDGKPLDVFLAGDNEEAKDKLSKAINDSGLRAVDVGGLIHAHDLEAMLVVLAASRGQFGNAGPVAIKILP